MHLDTPLSRPPNGYGRAVIHRRYFFNNLPLVAGAGNSVCGRELVTFCLRSWILMNFLATIRRFLSSQLYVPKSVTDRNASLFGVPMDLRCARRTNVSKPDVCECICETLQASLKQLLNRAAVTARKVTHATASEQQRPQRSRSRLKESSINFRNCQHWSARAKGWLKYKDS